MNDVDIKNRIAELLKSSRYDAGMSQDSVAKCLGVSKKTVQNWEAGISSPPLSIVMQWFDYLDVPVYPYILKLSHPELELLNANSCDEEIRDALMLLVKDMDIKKMRQHFFEAFGEHGTAPDGMGEVKTAYLHLPMDVKVGIAEIICTQFEICQAQGRLVQPDSIMPNVESLKSYIDSAKQAVIKGKDTYLIK